MPAIFSKYSSPILAVRVNGQIKRYNPKTNLYIMHYNDIDRSGRLTHKMKKIMQNASVNNLKDVYSGLDTL